MPTSPVDEPVDAVGHHLERVDVESGIGLVQIAICGCKQLELEDLVSLLLATGEALVDIALGERRVDGERVHRLVHLLDPGAQLRRLAVDRGRSRTKEVGDRNAGNLHGVLHGQEEPGAGPRVDGHREHVLAVEGDRALG